MSEDSFIFKILVCGPAAVGKTCLVHRYVDNVFLDDTQSTIGVDFSLKNIHIETPEYEQGPITLQIWDLAGEQAFREILPYYVQGSHGILFVFDITDPDSLVELQEWVDFIRPLIPYVPSVLISTKHDLESSINPLDIIAFGKKNDISTHFETSSKENQNVHEAFIELAKKVIISSKD